MPLARALKEEQSPRPAAAQCCHLCVCKTREVSGNNAAPEREAGALEPGRGGPGRHPTRALLPPAQVASL